MKQVYLFLIMFAMGSTAFAQSFTVSPGTDAYMTVPEKQEVEATIYFTNDRASDQTLVWEQTANTMNPNWSVSVCDNNLCYFSAWPGDTMLPVANGANGFLKFTVEIDAGDAGDGILSYSVSFEGEPSTAVEVTFHINGTVDVTPASFVNEIKIGPNPTSGTLTMRASTTTLEKGSVEIYDLSGKLLFLKSVSGVESMDIDVQSLAEGTYLLRYLSDKGVVTRRFVRHN